MHLKKLELSGFKSFAKKTTLDFPKGITVVAGPNGSGKSNVVDAIRWALAEQSYKNLRGKKGEDLIFYGSGSRSSLARANVAMSFDLADEENNPVNMAEVMLEREVDKSGENSYLLNGRKVRLTDMEEFLAKSRIGDSSFRVISQGMSDRFLNLSPQEFRGFIEEAAGVKEFQDKKHLTLLKIKNTNENLEKVGAILAELKPQIRLLKREKEKLEKKEAYLAELKKTARELFGLKYKTITASENKISEKKRNLTREIKPLTEEVKNLRTDLFSFDKKSALSLEIARLATEVRQLENEDNNLTRQAIGHEGKINLEEEKEKQRLPVSVDYLKEKIGFLVAKLNVDFKGLDIDSLKHLLGVVTVGLQDLLKVIEQGVDPVHSLNSTVPILKAGLEKILTQQIELHKKLEAAVLVRTEKEKLILEDRHVALAKEKSYREKESELYRLETSLRQLELEEEKIKLHQAKFNQDLAGIGVVTLADILDFNNENYKNKVVLAGSVEANEAVLEDKLFKLKRQVEEVGLIDERVVQEFEGVNERYEFLSKETNDLSATLISLNSLVGNLDSQINSKYKNTLAEMNHVFGGYFRLIFGGGKASLTEARIMNKELGQEDNEEENQRGVELKLELPNKKVKNLSTLSGGERTLTSIALLFALASIRKPPVMVLDEIDAALDEANTQKFVRLVKELSKNTQFIIITHNRETMQGADALYGVSMKDGISHLLSLKLQSA